MSTVDAVILLLVAVSGALVFLNLLLRGVGVEPYITLFSVTVEANVPTWFASGLLLVAGVVAATVGALVPRGATAARRSWFVFAGVLVVLSLDDTVSLHERLGGIGDDLVGGFSAGGLLHFTWVVPGVVAAGLVVVSMVQLARRLSRQVRRQLVFGTVLFFSGALGAEMASGVVLDAVGDGLGYALITAVEELLEMLGVVVILRAVLQVVDMRRMPDGSVSVRYLGTLPSGHRAAGALHPLPPARGAEVPDHRSGESDDPERASDQARRTEHLPVRTPTARSGGSSGLGPSPVVPEAAPPAISHTTAARRPG